MPTTVRPTGYDPSNVPQRGLRRFPSTSPFAVKHVHKYRLLHCALPQAAPSSCHIRPNAACKSRYSFASRNLALDPTLTHPVNVLAPPPPPGGAEFMPFQGLKCHGNDQYNDLATLVFNPQVRFLDGRWTCACLQASAWKQSPSGLPFMFQRLRQRSKALHGIDTDPARPHRSSVPFLTSHF